MNKVEVAVSHPRRARLILQRGTAFSTPRSDRLTRWHCRWCRRSPSLTADPVRPGRRRSHFVARDQAFPSQPRNRQKSTSVRSTWTARCLNGAALYSCSAHAIGEFPSASGAEVFRCRGTPGRRSTSNADRHNEMLPGTLQCVYRPPVDLPGNRRSAKRGLPGFEPAGAGILLPGLLQCPAISPLLWP